MHLRPLYVNHSIKAELKVTGEGAMRVRDHAGETETGRTAGGPLPAVFTATCKHNPQLGPQYPSALPRPMELEFSYLPG